MSLKARYTIALLTLVSLPIRPASAEESDTNEPATAACVSAYEQAQEQRHHGKLLEARVQLQACARDSCPEFIRKDCVAWHGEVQAEVPTIVFTARSAGRDLTEVRVSLGQRELASRIDGQAIELDPGEYDLKFTAPGMQPLAQHVLISRGERNRLQRAELVPLSNVATAAGQAATLPPPSQRSWVLPGVFAGVAVLGLSSFAAFGAWGHSAESTLKTTCSPNCSRDQISEVQTKYAVADISLAVGVASLGLATYFALSSSPQRRTGQSSPFDVQASAHGLSASYRGAF
jgi:hypothetical protein